MTTTNCRHHGAASVLDVCNVQFTASDSAQTRREKLARIVLDEMYQFVGLLDARGITLEINRAALEGAGIRFEDIHGKPFWEAHWWSFSKETQDAQRELIRRAAQGEFIRCDIEIFGQDAGEETIIIDYSLRPIKDQDGNIVFLLPEGRNITEKKRNEAEIARKNEELQRLLEKIRHLDDVKSDFFANVSHELRTPLALILGPVESLLAAPDNLTERQRRDLAVIHRNTSTLAKHVNDLLDLAKFDAGKMALNYARVDLARALRCVAAHFDALATQRSLAYVICAPEVLEAQADPEKFDRVLLNLLSNAFKFTPDGGRIRCTLETSGAGRLLLSIQDSGPGVRPDMREAIFDRFRQAQGGTTREFGGTGLGLAIAKDVVQLHGGTVSVTQAPGGGALFQVEMPLHAPGGVYVRERDAWHGDSAIDGTIKELQGNDADADAEPPAAGSAGLPQVLVAEDNAEMRRFISEVLGAHYRVVAVADGAAALAHALADPPDLVVMDLMMPKLGGDRVVEAMRSRPALANVPVLVLSAKADDALRLELLSERVQDYLTKPFSARELRIRVRNLVMMKRTRDALQTELATQNQDLAQLTQQLIVSRQALRTSLDSLQESEHRWRAVYENSAVGIALTGLNGRIVAANPACQRILGYAAEEIRGISLSKITSADDRAATQANIAQLLAGNLRAYHLQKRYARKDGSFVWANASVSLIPGNKNMGPTMIAIIEDITERKRAEEALAQSQLELARVTRVTTMGELVASIAHEVNQPLAAIVTNGHACLRWLDAEPSNIGEANEAVRHIIRDANRASGVIAHIRGFIKRGEPHRTRVRVPEVIAEVVSLVQDVARSAAVSLLERSAPDLPFVVADRVQLQQVILNLLMNAIEAMGPASERPRIVQVWADSHGPEAILISVRDDGIGFDGPHSARMFDAFYTTKPEGMGMGLTISRSIVEAHGGRLWGTANNGSGVTFRVSLPVAQEEQA